MSTGAGELTCGDLSAFDRSSWDRLVFPGTAPLSYDLLAPCHGSLAGFRWRAFGADVPHDDAPAMRASGFLHRLDLRGLLPAGVRRFAPPLATTVLELGNPCCPSPPLLTRADRPAAAWLPALWRRFVADGEAGALVVRDVADAELSAALRRAGFALVAERPTFVLPLPGSFDDYLAALRAPYRRRARRYLSLPHRVELASDFAERAAEMARLFALNADRSRESRHEHIDAAAVGAWSKAAATAALTVADPASGARAVALVVVDPPVLHFHRCGFEAAAGRESGVYLRLLYELVRAAIATGCDRLDLGLTCADPKLRLGARPVPLEVWARHRAGPVQALLRRLAARARPVAAVTPHSVFRDPPATVAAHWYRCSAPVAADAAPSTAAAPSGAPPPPRAR